MGNKKGKPEQQTINYLIISGKIATEVKTWLNQGYPDPVCRFTLAVEHGANGGQACKTVYGTSVFDVYFDSTAIKQQHLDLFRKGVYVVVEGSVYRLKRKVSETGEIEQTSARIIARKISLVNAISGEPPSGLVTKTERNKDACNKK